jgi:hypothetical protein
VVLCSALYHSRGILWLLFSGIAQLSAGKLRLVWAAAHEDLTSCAGISNICCSCLTTTLLLLGMRSGAAPLLATPERVSRSVVPPAHTGQHPRLCNFVYLSLHCCCNVSSSVWALQKRLCLLQ